MHHTFAMVLWSVKPIMTHKEIEKTVRAPGPQDAKWTTKGAVFFCRYYCTCNRREHQVFRKSFGFVACMHTGFRKSN